VWNAAKSSTGVVALKRRFYGDLESKPKRGKLDSHGRSYPVRPRQKHLSALVDVVAEDGAEWIKISSTTEKRILFDLARAGWVEETSSDEESNRSDDDDAEDGSLIKLAEVLSKISKSTRVRYRNPKVRLLLPRVKRGSIKQVDKLLGKIEALGIEVQTSEIASDTPSISRVLQRMAVDPYSRFSDTLNIDCTALLAFVSDISHGTVAPEDWHHHAISRQIEMEKEDQLLPSSVWPACGSRPLVSTREAITRMNEIVDLIGTESEKKRRDCLIDMENSTVAWSREDRLNMFQELSAYAVPREWILPITQVESESAKQDNLPSVARKVAPCLSTINESVFLYGWATGRTTISSNRGVKKTIEMAVENNRVDDDEVGPDIWLFPTARSLVGKEKLKRNSNNFDPTRKAV
jgi:hypothetical protein